MLLIFPYLINLSIRLRYNILILYFCILRPGCTIYSSSNCDSNAGKVQLPVADQLNRSLICDCTTGPKYFFFLTFWVKYYSDWIFEGLRVGPSAKIAIYLPWGPHPHISIRQKALDPCKGSVLRFHDEIYATRK